MTHTISGCKDFILHFSSSNLFKRESALVYQHLREIIPSKKSSVTMHNLVLRGNMALVTYIADDAVVIVHVMIKNITEHLVPV